jgi:hypothetical protein
MPKTQKRRGLEKREKFWDYTTKDVRKETP